MDMFPLPTLVNSELNLNDTDVERVVMPSAFFEEAAPAQSIRSRSPRDRLTKGTLKEEEYGHDLAIQPSDGIIHFVEGEGSSLYERYQNEKACLEHGLIGIVNTTHFK